MSNEELWRRLTASYAASAAGKSYWREYDADRGFDEIPDEAHAAIAKRAARKAKKGGKK